MLLALLTLGVWALVCVGVLLLLSRERRLDRRIAELDVPEWMRDEDPTFTVSTNGHAKLSERLR